MDPPSFMRLTSSLALVAILLSPGIASASPGDDEAPPLSITPTASGAIGHTSNRGDGWVFEEHRFAALWSGVTIYPEPANVAGFVSLGAQVHLWAHEETSLSAAIIPTVRGGIAGLMDPDSFLGRMLPLAKGYGLVGYRIPRQDEDGAFQVGLGISVPPLLVVTGALADADVFFPTALEATVDIDLHGEAERYQLRYGVEF